MSRAGRLGEIAAAARRRAPDLVRALRIVWSAARGWTAAWLAILVLQGLVPVGIVYLTRGLVNAVVDVQQGAEPVRTVVVLAAAMAALLLLQQILRSALTWVRTAQAELVQDRIVGLLHRQSARADIAFYEAPEYYDHLHRARLEASRRPTELVENLGALLQHGITLVAMAVVLLPYGWWLPPLLVLSTLPALAVVLHYAVRLHAWRRRMTETERRVWYYDWLMTTRESAAELRVFGLAPRFTRAWQDLRRSLRGDRLDLARRESRAELGAGVVALLVTAAALAWMGWRVLQGAARLGDLALFYQAFTMGQGMMRNLLENVGRIYGNMLFLGDLFEFLDLEPEVVDPPRPAPLPAVLAGEIRFEGVTFRYPGVARAALEDFDLVVPAGAFVAVVGPNGAGKSTLIKLICRFYDPARGAVRIDRVDVREVAKEDLLRRISVLFQEPLHYNATAAENVGLGRVDRPVDEARLREAIRAAGAEEIVARLPQGPETMLGRWFARGVELSVGEWQRIALARAFLRDAEILLLDEPTSAMDSWAENDWHDRVRRLAVGKTVVLITHRFTTAMRADTIHVMDEGRIVESGTHGELLDGGGLYARSWHAQWAERARRGEPV